MAKASNISRTTAEWQTLFLSPIRILPNSECITSCAAYCMQMQLERLDSSEYTVTYCSFVEQGVQVYYCYL